MREIILRGKRADNGEWVYGRALSDVVIAPKGQKFKLDDGMYVKGLIGHVVDPATAGQYTGLTDKNGKRIFEGDMVRYKDRIFGEVVGVIEYDDCCFCVHTLRSPNSPTIDIVMNESEVEVIGNITDNSDLLKALECVRGKYEEGFKDAIEYARETFCGTCIWKQRFGTKIELTDKNAETGKAEEFIKELWQACAEYIAERFDDKAPMAQSAKNQAEGE